MKKYKAKLCRKCSGHRVVMDHMEGRYDALNTKIEVSNVAYKLCPECRGTGIVGVPPLTDLSIAQLATLMKGRDGTDLLRLFDHRTAEEVDGLIHDAIAAPK